MAKAETSPLRIEPITKVSPASIPARLTLVTDACLAIDPWSHTAECHLHGASEPRPSCDAPSRSDWHKHGALLARIGRDLKKSARHALPPPPHTATAAQAEPFLGLPRGVCSQKSNKDGANQRGHGKKNPARRDLVAILALPSSSSPGWAKRLHTHTHIQKKKGVGSICGSPELAGVAAAKPFFFQERRWCSHHTTHVNAAGAVATRNGPLKHKIASTTHGASMRRVFFGSLFRPWPAVAA
jgi:hypothetical protein